GVVLAGDVEAGLRERPVSPRVLDRRGQAYEGHAGIAANLLGEDDERRRPQPLADARLGPDEDVDVDRARRDLVQPQRIQRGTVDPLPSQIADLFRAPGDDGLPAAGGGLAAQARFASGS